MGYFCINFRTQKNTTIRNHPQIGCLVVSSALSISSAGIIIVIGGVLDRSRKVPQSSKEDCFASRSVLGRREELSRVLLRYNGEVRFGGSGGRYSRSPNLADRFRALLLLVCYPFLHTNQEEILPCKHR